MVKKGHFPEGTTASGCFYHEFGHAVEYSRGVQSNKKYVDKILFDYGYGRLNTGQRNTALRKELSSYSAILTNPSY